MSEYDNGYARAQAMYDAMEPPDYSQQMCRCGYRAEDHVTGDIIDHGITVSSRDGVGFCPDEVVAIIDLIRDSEFQAAPEPEEDPDRRRDERYD